MKSLFFTLGTAMLQNWLSPKANSPSQQNFATVPKLNVSYLSGIAKRFSANAGSAFIFSLFFVSGSVMAIYSAAQSFDLFGVFVAGSVFYVGLGISIFSLLIVGGNISNILKIKINADLVYLYEQAPTAIENGRGSFDIMKVAAPLVSGLVSGWATGRTRSRERQESETAAHPETKYQGPRAV